MATPAGRGTGAARRASLWRALLRRSVAARERAATTTFMLGSVAASDRLIAGLHFALAAPRWGQLADDPAHLAAYRAGLGHVGIPRRVLDVGTGTGGSAATAAAAFPDAVVVGLDASRAMLRLARARHHAANLTFRRGSVLALPFPAASFDLVASLNAVPEPTEVARVCTADGRLLVASSLAGLRGEASAWVGRWREAGFAREQAGEAAGGGSWEVFVRA